MCMCVCSCACSVRVCALSNPQSPRRNFKSFFQIFFKKMSIFYVVFVFVMFRSDSEAKVRLVMYSQNHQEPTFLHKTCYGTQCAWAGQRRARHTSVQHLVIAYINIRVTSRSFELDANTPLGAFVLEFEVAILPLLDRSLYPLVSLQLLCLHGCISATIESTLLTTYASARELVDKRTRLPTRTQAWAIPCHCGLDCTLRERLSRAG